jgi:tetratricopeptide (TPR) repeat protein
MREHPAAWSALLFKKFVLVWNAREIDRNQDSSVMREASLVWRLLGVPWVLLSVCGLVGVGLVWRRRGLHPLHTLLLLQLLGVMAFFVTTRYRLVLLPWLAIAAAVTLLEVSGAVWRRQQSRIILLTGLLLLALLLALPDWFGVGRHPFGRPEFDRAQVLARRGEREAALEAYEAAVASHPRDPDVLFRYGEHLERMGRRDDAIAAYEATAELAPQSYKPMLALGAAYLLADDLESAWGSLVEAERRGDPSGRTLYDMGLVRERQGEHEEALSLFERSVGKRDAPYEIAVRRLALARCLIRLQRPEAAEIQFRAAEPLFRDARRVPLERADAWLGAGEPTRALVLLQGVPGVDGSVRAQFIRARALRDLGRESEARAAAERALQLDPAATAVHDFLNAPRSTP